MERRPNLKEEVDGSIPGCEISSLLDKNLSGGQLPHVCLALGWQPSVSIKKLKMEKFQ